MRRIAFDFDNTLVDCLPSDYAIYLATCNKLLLPSLSLNRYEQLRRAGSFNQILEETYVTNETVFRQVRNKFALNEEFCLKDKAILDIRLLLLVHDSDAFAIISSRDKKEILDKQIGMLGWRKHFQLYCVPRGTDDFVAEAKKGLLIEFNATHFVGDKLSDVRAAKNAGVVPVLVRTGFRHVPAEGAVVAKDVNAFLCSLELT
jgi:phosphoglycolate phosphatase-like HAD superfamily hydrolase